MVVRSAKSPQLGQARRCSKRACVPRRLKARRRRGAAPLLRRDVLRFRFSRFLDLKAPFFHVLERRLLRRRLYMGLGYRAYPTRCMHPIQGTRGTPPHSPESPTPKSPTPESPTPKSPNSPGPRPPSPPVPQVPDPPRFHYPPSPPPPQVFNPRSASPSPSPPPPESPTPTPASP